MIFIINFILMIKKNNNGNKEDSGTEFMYIAPF